MEWYYMKDASSRMGPFTEEEFRALIDSKQVAPATWVWNDSLPDWIPYAKILPQEPAAPVSAPPEAVFTETPPAQEVRLVYAGFWIRVLAVIADGLICWGLIKGFSLLFEPLIIQKLGDLAARNPQVQTVTATIGYAGFNGIIQFLIDLLYTVLLVGTFGATIGKLLFGLKIVSPGRRKVSYLRALARYFAQNLSMLVFGIGFIIAAFDDQKRALHDHICKTRVVKTR